MGRLIAVIDNGLHARQVFGAEDDVTLHYSCDLGSSPGNLVDLLRTPVIVIPFHSDQNLLARYQKQLKQYITNGGILIVLGANQDSGYPWIPYIQWINNYPRYTRRLTGSPDHSALLADLHGDDALSYHDGFAVHGLIDPGAVDVQAGDSIIAEGYNESAQSWQPIFVVKRSSWKGTFLTTTLDPDFHSHQAVYAGFGPRGETVRSNAKILLRNILDWSREEAKTKSAQVGFAGHVPTNTREAGYADVAIITALENPELDAVLNAAGGRTRWASIPLQDDPNRYYETAIETSSGRQLRIVAASPDRTGLTSSAILATKLLCTFRPKLLIMVGVAAGFDTQGISVGNVLVADHVVDYGSGKLTLDQDGNEQFLATPSPAEITPRARQILASRKRDDKQILWEIKNSFQGPKPNTDLNLIIGPLASGDLVIDSPKKVSDLLHLWRNMIGVEMEVYAVYQACHKALHPPPEYFCLKSVCDLGKDKTDQWQSFAAFVSANYAFHLIRGPLESIFSD